MCVFLEEQSLINMTGAINNNNTGAIRVKSLIVVDCIHK
jgi:hypothetical protein